VYSVAVFLFQNYKKWLRCGRRRGCGFQEGGEAKIQRLRNISCRKNLERWRDNIFLKGGIQPMIRGLNKIE